MKPIKFDCVWQQRIALGAAVLLTLLASAYLIRGTFFMFSLAADYQQRWVEEHYLLRGENPLDVFQYCVAQWNHSPLPASPRDHAVEPDLGPVYGSYPPWAYGTGFIWTWPPEMKLGRAIFALLNLLMLAAVVCWVYHL